MIILMKDIEVARNGFQLTKGKSFILDLFGHSIRYVAENIESNGCILHIDGGAGQRVRIMNTWYEKPAALLGKEPHKYHVPCIRLDSGMVELYNGIDLKGSKVLIVKSGEIDVYHANAKTVRKTIKIKVI